MRIKFWKTACGAATAMMLFANSSFAMSLHEAVKHTLETNPNIGRVEANREAVEFELRQALGLYAPRVDLEASMGIERLDSPSRRAAGTQGNALFPSKIGIVASYDILDGGYRDAEVARQAARVDGASYRVLEESEASALEVSRLYFEILLQGRIVELNQQNLAFHQATLGDVVTSITNGKLTEADRRQATERLAASRASLVQAAEQLAAAQIGFHKVVGTAYDGGSLPKRIANYLPASEAALIERALASNPQLLAVAADLDTAAALVDQAMGALGPKLSMELSANSSLDQGGVTGYSTDLQGRLVFRWNLYDGGIKDAKVQENLRRETEAIFAQQVAGRDVTEGVRLSRNRLAQQKALAQEYRDQSAASEDLVSAYREQFTVGQRTLLDVLDAQNTRFNSQILSITADYSARFAEYRLLASTGTLLAFLGIAEPERGEAYARDLMKTDGADIEADLKSVKPLDLLSATR